MVCSLKLATVIYSSLGCCHGPTSGTDIVPLYLLLSTALLSAPISPFLSLSLCLCLSFCRRGFPRWFGQANEYDCLFMRMRANVYMNWETLLGNSWCSGWVLWGVVIVSSQREYRQNRVENPESPQKRNILVLWRYCVFLAPLPLGCPLAPICHINHPCQQPLCPTCVLALQPSMFVYILSISPYTSVSHRALALRVISQFCFVPADRIQTPYHHGLISNSIT